MSDMLEMKIERVSELESMVECGFVKYEAASAVEPVFAVTDEGTEIIGTFAQSGKTGVAVKKKDDCKIYYCAIDNLPAALLQKIAKDAGVHIYSEHGIATYVNSSFYGLYNANVDETEITLPVDGSFREIFSSKVYTTKNKKITLPTKEHPAQMLVRNQ